MGQLFTRLSTGWFEYPSSSSELLTQNVVAISPITTKRKCFHEDIITKKRRTYLNRSYSSRLANTSFSFSSTSIVLFKCQLCYHCFSAKDCYLDHMIICAIEHHASIKIVRANRK